MSDIFISYAHHDKEVTEKLANALKAKDWSIWYDDRLLVGTKWQEKIEEEIRSATCFITLLSLSANSSKWVKEEKALAERLKKLIFPILIEKIEIPFGFLTTQCIELIDWDGSFSDTQYTKLIESLYTALPSTKYISPSEEITIPAPAEIKEDNFLFPTTEYEIEKVKAEDILKKVKEEVNKSSFQKAKPNLQTSTSAVKENDHTAIQMKAFLWVVIKNIILLFLGLIFLSMGIAAIQGDPDTFKEPIDRVCAVIIGVPIGCIILYYRLKALLKSIINTSSETFAFLFDNRITRRYKAAEALRLNEDYENAIHNLFKIIETNPNFSDAYASRGLSYMSLGEEEKALKDLQRAVQLKTKRYEVYEYFGKLLYDKHEYEEAIKLLSLAIEKCGENWWERTEEIKLERAELYNLIGQCYIYLSKYNEAMDNYDKALENNVDPTYYLNRSNAYLKLGNYQMANLDIENYQKAMGTYSYSQNYGGYNGYRGYGETRHY